MVKPLEQMTCTCAYTLYSSSGYICISGRHKMETISKVFQITVT